MALLGWILLVIALIMAFYRFFIEHWYAALAVAAGIVIFVFVFTVRRKNKKKKAEQELNALKQEEADIRERLYDCDVTEILFEQYRAKAQESLEYFKSLALKAPQNEQYVSGRIEVNASVCGIDGINFEKDLRKTRLKNNLEASALAYIVAKEMLNELEKYRGFQGISISQEVQQSRITKTEDRDKCRKAYISVSVENPNYVEISDWKNNQHIIP